LRAHEVFQNVIDEAVLLVDQSGSDQVAGSPAGSDASRSRVKNCMHARFTETDTKTSVWDSKCFPLTPSSRAQRDENREGASGRRMGRGITVGYGERQEFKVEGWNK
jgi:hypothetical protein